MLELYSGMPASEALAKLNLLWLMVLGVNQLDLYTASAAISASTASTALNNIEVLASSVLALNSSATTAATTATTAATTATTAATTATTAATTATTAATAATTAATTANTAATTATTSSNLAKASSDIAAAALTVALNNAALVSSLTDTAILLCNTAVAAKNTAMTSANLAAAANTSAQEYSILASNSAQESVAASYTSNINKDICARGADTTLSFAHIAVGATNTMAVATDSVMRKADELNQNIDNLLSKLGGELFGPLLTFVHLFKMLAVTDSTIDLLQSNFFTKNILGTTSLNLSNISLGGTLQYFILETTSSITRQITWWPGIRWANNLPINLLSGIDIFFFYTTTGGASWVGIPIARNIL